MFPGRAPAVDVSLDPAYIAAQAGAPTEVAESAESVDVEGDFQLEPAF
jgi:hypothetical protein